MARQRITPPPTVPVDEPTDRLETWLNRSGCRTASVAWDGGELVVDTEGDAVAALGGYVSSPTPEEKATARLTSYLQIYRDGGTPTANQVARALKSLIAVQLRQMDDVG